MGCLQFDNNEEGSACIEIGVEAIDKGDDM